MGVDHAELFQFAARGRAVNEIGQLLRAFDDRGAGNHQVLIAHGENPAFANRGQRMHLIPSAHVRIAIHEGRKRQVRRMLGAVGHPVVELTRTHVGPLALGELAPGEARPLTGDELQALRELVGLPAAAPASPAA